MDTEKSSGKRSKLTTQLSISGVSILIAVCILVFQNCSKLSYEGITGGEISAKNAGLSAFDQDAVDMFTAMSTAGIADDNEFDDVINMTTDSMTCGVKLQTTTAQAAPAAQAASAAQCVFISGTKKSVTPASASALSGKLMNYLISSGIRRDCPTCNEAESYTVYNVACKKNPKLARDTTCLFTTK